MRRWYTHRWNSTSSFRLIRTVVPKVPRWFVPSLGVVTATICFASMRTERRAALRNLRRILNRGGWRLHLAAWRLFYHFSRFMVSYTELGTLRPEEIRGRMAADPVGDAVLRDALALGRGAIVLTAHIGNWEVGSRLLELTGAPVNVVMQVERRNAVERWLLRARASRSLRVVQVGRDPTAVLALRAVLARNEILAMQGDRAPGERRIRVELFGAPFDVPLGPFLLARACDAPLLPAFVLQEGWWRWRSELGPPIRAPRSGDREADLLAGASAYARRLEEVVARHPDQWFNFFELWEAPSR